MSGKKNLPDNHIDDILALMNSVVGSFSNVTKVPVTLYSEDGNIVREYLKEKKICRFFRAYNNKNSKCRSLISFAGEFSSGLGDPYIFLCRAGLANIAVPLVADGKLEGYFIAGPFFLKKAKTAGILKYGYISDTADSDIDSVLKFAETVPVFSPEEVSSLSVLLSNCVLSAGISGVNSRNSRRQYNEQINTGSRIRRAKKEHEDIRFPYELQERLISLILQGKRDEADEMIGLIVDRLSVACHGDLDEIKTMSVWITANIFKSISDEDRIRPGDYMDIELDVINRINDSPAQSDLADTFRSILRQMNYNMLSSVYKGDSPLIIQGLRYIRLNYAQKITLTDIADHLHVNPSYYSSLFSHEMGRSFSEYLTSLRIEKASDLLINTNLSITEVALKSGFEDQSYFTKVFRNQTGHTPRQFRLLKSGSD